MDTNIFSNVFLKVNVYVITGTFIFVVFSNKNTLITFSRNVFSVYVYLFINHCQLYFCCLPPCLSTTQAISYRILSFFDESYILCI